MLDGEAEMEFAEGGALHAEANRLQQQQQQQTIWRFLDVKLLLKLVAVICLFYQGNSSRTFGLIAGMFACLARLL